MHGRKRNEQVGPGRRKERVWVSHPAHLLLCPRPWQVSCPRLGAGRSGVMEGLGWSRWSFIALMLGNGRPGCRLARTEVKGFPFCWQ